MQANVKATTNKVTKNREILSVFYQITKNNQTKKIPASITINCNEWDKSKRSININATSNEHRQQTLLYYRDNINSSVLRLSKLLSNENSDTTSIANEFNNTTNKATLYSFILTHVENLRQLGKDRTAETYMCFLNSHIHFFDGHDVLLKQIDSHHIEAYECYLRNKKVTLNTVSFYLRRFRAIYNRAIELNLITNKNIFKRAYLSSEKTTKRAIPINHISKIKNLDLQEKRKLEFYRDLFLFSFYTRGMSFVDIAYLEKGDVKNGTLTYIRKKTGQRLQIKMEQCIENIIKKYNNPSSPFLLPIINENEKNHRTQYLNKLAKTNRALKDIATLAKIGNNLTMYVARHSWTTAAKNKNIPISIISEGMGHDSETTTQIYLASIENNLIDKANKRIISFI